MGSPQGKRNGDIYGLESSFLKNQAKATSQRHRSTRFSPKKQNWPYLWNQPEVGTSSPRFIRRFSSKRILKICILEQAQHDLWNTAVTCSTCPGIVSLTSTLEGFEFQETPNPKAKARGFPSSTVRIPKKERRNLPICSSSLISSRSCVFQL